MSSATTAPSETSVSAPIRSFFSTTIGKKYLMAITGLVWAGFVFTHMAGNMLIFVSKDAYNSYGHAIATGAILLPTEIILVLSLIVHVTTAIRLTIENRRARGAQRYAAQAKGKKAATLASRTMMVQGSIILVFIISHIATFKYGTYYETSVKGVVMRDLARLMVEIFKQPGFVAWYIVSLFILGFHLKHGFGSTLQSLGIKNQQMEKWIPRISAVYASVVALGFMSQPIYVLFMLE